MSVANTLIQKRLRSQSNAARKAEAAERIPHCGVIVTKRIVKIHRYLKAKGLPFSKRIASIFISSNATRRKEQELDLDRVRTSRLSSPARRRVGIAGALLGLLGLA